MGNSISNNNSKTVFKITITAMMSALATVLMLLQFSVPLMPGFIKLDFSDLPAAFASMFISPASGVVVCLIKNLIHLLFPNNASIGVGELSNFFLSSTFVLTTGLIYRKLKTKKGLVLSGICGAVAMGCVSVPVNYFVTYPMYMKFMPIEAILAEYQAIFPGVNSLLSSLLIFNLPFNIIKCLLNLVLAVLMYSVIQPLFKKYLK